MTNFLIGLANGITGWQLLSIPFVFPLLVIVAILLVAVLLRPTPYTFTK